MQALDISLFFPEKIKKDGLGTPISLGSTKRSRGLLRIIDSYFQVCETASLSPAQYAVLLDSMSDQDRHDCEEWGYIPYCGKKIKSLGV